MKIDLKSSIDFSNAKTGDFVFCAQFGIGKIIKIYTKATYPVEVIFAGDLTDTFTLEGKTETRHKYASLYFFDPRTSEILYSCPKPKICWSEYEEKMIKVRDGDRAPWQFRILWKYAPEFTKPFICYNGDLKTNSPIAWPQACLPEEDLWKHSLSDSNHKKEEVV